jgi:hypothetical protein
LDRDTKYDGVTEFALPRKTTNHNNRIKYKLKVYHDHVWVLIEGKDSKQIEAIMRPHTLAGLQDKVKKLINELDATTSIPDTAKQPCRTDSSTAVKADAVGYAAREDARRSRGSVIPAGKSVSEGTPKPSAACCAIS